MKTFDELIRDYENRLEGRYEASLTDDWQDELDIAKAMLRGVYEDLVEMSTPDLAFVVCQLRELADNIEALQKAKEEGRA